MADGLPWALIKQNREARLSVPVVCHRGCLDLGKKILSQALNVTGTFWDKDVCLLEPAVATGVLGGHMCVQQPADDSGMKAGKKLPPLLNLDMVSSAVLKT